MTVAAPAGTAWRCSRLTSGAWRLEHIASGSVVFIAKGASEAAVQRLRPDRGADRETGQKKAAPMSDSRMVKLCDLWQRKSAKGTTYFSGFLGDAQLLLFKDGERPHPTRPDETVIVWKLLVQERDPARRPQIRQPTPGADP
jgi:hypothetical protein